LIGKLQASLEKATELYDNSSHELRSIMRNVILAVLTLTGLTMLHQEEAQAATEYPYCLSYTQGWSGMIEDCSYSTMEQCRMSTGGIAGSCAPNWRLQFKNSNNPEPKKRDRSRR
jgi:hypothetical protein